MLNLFQLNRRAIRRKNKLLTGLLQIIEYMEERILRSFESSEILYIVHDKHINRLIEIEEIRNTVIERSVLILHLESVRAHV